MASAVCAGVLVACGGGGSDGGVVGPGGSDGGGNDGGNDGGGNDGGGNNGRGGGDDPRNGGGGDWPEWDDGDGSVGVLPDGTNVALVEALASPMDWFNLRVTMPVPRGTYPRSDGLVPFGIRNWDDSVLEAQVEIVSRYPEGWAGADVVEVTGRVSKPPGFPTGAPLLYGIVASPHAPQAEVSHPIDHLKWRPIQVPDPIHDFLDDSNSLQIRTKDCFGHVYVHKPLQSPHKKVLKSGETTAQIRTHGSMEPVEWVDGSAGTLPHMMGVHSYLSTYRQEGFMSFDMRIHNAHSNFDQNDSRDDALGTVYFEDLEVLVPSGWTLQQNVEDPMFGESYYEDGYRVYPVVKPMDGNKMHVMPWQSQFHRRLIISIDSEWQRALGHLNGYGIGFVKDATDPFEGHEAYSWWNPGTARYFPQNHLLPLLDHVGQTNIRNQLIGEINSLHGHMTNGTGTGQYPVHSPRMGWAHPYGVGYGGMTGGDEIIMYDGVRTAWSASLSGIQLATLRHRMHSDRQADCLFDMNGDPTQVNQWVIWDGQMPYVPFLFYQLPFLNNGDPFGVNSSPDFQRAHVSANNRKPPYEGELFSFKPHDQQHLIRYTHTPKVLVWLANDSLAKDDLLMQTEVWHLSYHEFYKNQWGDTQVNGLLAHRNYIAQHPGSGFTFGRGEGWGLDCATATFAFMDDEWRNQKMPWFNQIAENLSNGIGSCNGFVQANVNEKFVQGLYRARQQIEQAIIENAIVGLIETVYKNRDAAYQAMLEDVLAQSTEAFIGPMAWFPGEGAPWTYTAVAPIPADQGIWCTQAELPWNGWTPSYETYQSWSSFAYGYEITGNSTFLDMAEVMTGGNDLEGSLYGVGTHNIGNRAALLALLQRLNGQL